MPISLPPDLQEADKSPELPASLTPSVIAEPAEPAESVAIEPVIEPFAEVAAEPSVPMEAIANPNPPPTPITPANVNRWPDPIPFGQPLP